MKLSNEQFNSLVNLIYAISSSGTTARELRVARELLVEDEPEQSGISLDNIDKALIGIRPYNHPEAYKILTGLKSLVSNS